MQPTEPPGRGCDGSAAAAGDPHRGLPSRSVSAERDRTQSLPGRDRLGWLDFIVIVTIGSVLYLPTLHHVINWYNSGELVVAALTLEVPHPPGYPLYTRLANLFSRLPFGSPAARVGLLSVCAAIVAATMLAAFLKRLGVGRCAAVAAATMLMVAGNLWEQATNAEVYTVELVLLIGMWWLGVSWQPNAPVSRRTRVGLGLAVGLAITHRTNAVLYLPALLWLAGERIAGQGIDVVATLRRIVGHWSLFGLLLGLLPWADLAWRLHTQEGLLLEREIGLGWAGFWRVATCADFRGALFSMPPAVVIDRIRAVGQLLIRDFGLLWTGLALFALVRRTANRSGDGQESRVASPLDPVAAAGPALLWVLAANSFFVVNYDAFESHTMLLPSYSAVAALGGIGLGRALQTVTGPFHAPTWGQDPRGQCPASAGESSDGPAAAGPRLPGAGFPAHHPRGRRRPRLFGWLALILSVALMAHAAGQFSRLEPRDGAAEAWGRRLLASLPPQSNLVVSADIELRPIQYLTRIEGLRPDVRQIVVAGVDAQVIDHLVQTAHERPTFGSLIFPPSLGRQLAERVRLVPWGGVYRLSPADRRNEDRATGPAPLAMPSLTGSMGQASVSVHVTARRGDVASQAPIGSGVWEFAVASAPSPLIPVTAGETIEWGYRIEFPGAPACRESLDWIERHAIRFGLAPGMPREPQADGLPNDASTTGDRNETHRPWWLLGCLVRSDGGLVATHGVMLGHDLHLIGEGAVLAGEPVPTTIDVTRRFMVPPGMPTGEYTWRVAIASMSGDDLEASLAPHPVGMQPLNLAGGVELLRVESGHLPFRPWLKRFESWAALAGAGPWAVAGDGIAFRVRVMDRSQ